MNERLRMSKGFFAATLAEIGGAALLIAGERFGWPYWAGIAPWVLHNPAIAIIDMLRPVRRSMSSNLVFVVLLQWLCWILIFNFAFYLTALCQRKRKAHELAN
jgi:hypothetical protein